MQNNTLLNIKKIRLIISVLQGFVLYFLYTNSNAMPPAIFISASATVSLIPLLIVQSLGNMRLKTILIWSSMAAVILASIFYYAMAKQLLVLPSLRYVPTELILMTVTTLFIAHTLVLSADHDKHFIAQYPTYFDMAWKLAVQIALTIAFTLVFWLLLGLGVTLFDLIHLNFFHQLVVKPWFAIPVTTLVITIALHITDINVNIVRGMRTLILVLLSLLLPLLTFIISVFTLSLFFTGLTSLLQTGYASLLLFTSTSLLIILINTAYQNGQHLQSLTTLKRYSINISSCLLIPLVSIAIYALSLRVQQYGWTVQRIEAMAWAFIIAFYAIGYAASVFFSKEFFSLIERWNFAAACLIIAVYLALFTPLADPSRLMVISQIHRLQTGKIAPNYFDFEALRNQGMSYGLTALQNLQTTWNGPQKEYVREQATAALKINKTASKSKDTNTAIIAHTADGKLPPSFLQQQWEFFDGSFIVPNCLTKGSQTCQAWIVKDQKGAPMILLLETAEFTGFQQDTNGVWKILGKWFIPDECHASMQYAKEGKFKMAEPLPAAQADIEIMGWHARFEPNTGSKYIRCK